MSRAVSPPAAAWETARKVRGQRLVGMRCTVGGRGPLQARYPCTPLPPLILPPLILMSEVLMSEARGRALGRVVSLSARYPGSAPNRTGVYMLERSARYSCREKKEP